MQIKKESIIRPLPTDEEISEREEEWEVTLPSDYKEFLKKYNAGIPQQDSFVYRGHEYALIRFLGIIDDFEDNEMGEYDIEVVESEIGERLTDNEDLVGMEVVPIAELFAGDYLCLDLRKKHKLFGKKDDTPSVCVWDHEESGVFDPVTYKVADSFTDFLNMLH